MATSMVDERGMAVVTPDCGDGMIQCIDEDLMFYDCGTANRRERIADPTQRKVRGWLWRIRHCGVWRSRRPAFMIVKDGDSYDCTVGVLVPSSLSVILDSKDTIEFKEQE